MAPHHVSLIRVQAKLAKLKRELLSPSGGGGGGGGRISRYAAKLMDSWFRCCQDRSGLRWVHWYDIDAMFLLSDHYRISICRQKYVDERTYWNAQ